MLPLVRLSCPVPVMTIYMTPAQVAKALGIDAGKVTGWCKTGELRASNVARGVGRKARWRISQPDLEAFMARRANTPTPKPMRRSKRPGNVIQFY